MESVVAAGHTKNNETEIDGKKRAQDDVEKNSSAPYQNCRYESIGE